MYKMHRLMVCAFLALLGMRVEAAPLDLAGVWQGKLQVDPSTALTLQFIFTKKPDGGYTAVLDSPDNGGIKHVVAGAVAWDQGVLKLQVPALSGGYVGTFKGSSIEGQWTQEGGSLPLVLSPYQKKTLSKAAMQTLLGAWHWSVTFLGSTLTVVTNFKADEHGELVGTQGVLEQGNQQMPLVDIDFTDGDLSFKVPAIFGEMHAHYVDGSFVGSWRVGPTTAPTFPVTLKRGDVAMPVYALTLTSAQFASISGTWRGALTITTAQGQTTQLPLALRFETDKQAHYVGYIDAPGQGAKGIPVTVASFADGKLHLKVSAAAAEYSAEVTGSKMEGQWKQAGMVTPLALTKQ
jgi:hypothetical protein